MSENRFNKLKKIVCFYPSQIRNNLNIESKIDTKIIFAKKEDSFDTQKMKEILSIKENVNIRVEISDFEHGFMNE